MFLEWYLAAMAFIFGAVIGSFLNVVIYRLHTGRSLSGHSHCLSCQRPLAWYELIPIVSYLALRGRCRHCGAWIPLRYLVVEFMTASIFLWLWLTIDDPVLLGLLATLAAVLIVGIVYDVYHLIIPDEVSLAALGIAMVIRIYLAYPEFAWVELYQPLLSGALAGGFYAALWWVSRGRWLGLGDAKLAFPLGLLLSPLAVFSLVVLSFWIGAAVALGVIAWFIWRRWQPGYAGTAMAKSSRSLTMKSEIPFAPFLVIAFGLVFLAGADVLMLTAYVISTVSF